MKHQKKSNSGTEREHHLCVRKLNKIEKEWEREGGREREIERGLYIKTRTLKRTISKVCLCTGDTNTLYSHLSRPLSAPLSPSSSIIFLSLFSLPLLPILSLPSSLSFSSILTVQVSVMFFALMLMWLWPLLSRPFNLNQLEFCFFITLPPLPLFLSLSL